MADAKTTSRWYFVVAMGRKAGHLALGIGKATGATMTVIPESSRAARPRSGRWSTSWRRGHQTSGRRTALWRGGAGRGLAESIPEDDLKKLGPIDRDDAATSACPS